MGWLGAAGRLLACRLDPQRNGSPLSCLPKQSSGLNELRDGPGSRRLVRQTGLLGRKGVGDRCGRASDRLHRKWYGCALIPIDQYPDTTHMVRVRTLKQTPQDGGWREGPGHALVVGIADAIGAGHHPVEHSKPPADGREFLAGGGGPRGMQTPNFTLNPP